MAALLPGNRLSVDDSMNVLVDGQLTRSTADRNAVLNREKNSAAVQYTELLSMKKAERRELISGKDVVYIYHNAIDAIGDKLPTESKVFDACETAMQELSRYSAHCHQRAERYEHIYHRRSWFSVYLSAAERKRQGRPNRLLGRGL